MPSPLKEIGGRWEIKRGFLAPERALIAAHQVMWLASMELPFTTVTRPTRRLNRTRGMTVVGTKIHPTIPSQTPFTLDHYPEYWSHLDELSALFELTRKETRDTSGGFLGQVYDEGGQMGWHRDEDHNYCYAEDSMGVNLMGIGQLSIKDATGQILEFTLFPGDAFQLDNHCSVLERLLHKVKNVGGGKRVSFVD